MVRQKRDSEWYIREDSEPNFIYEINDIVRPFINVLIELHTISGDRKPQAETVHAKIRQFLEETMLKAKSLQLPTEDLRDLRYALVAFADELMQLETSRFSDFWRSHLLQVEHFDEALAGENFFKKLTQLRSDPKRYPVLHVYYLCMLFGFRGRYRGSEELAFENLLEEIRLDLEREVASSKRLVLSPHGNRPDDPAAHTRRNMLLQWLAIAAAVISLFWYAGLWLVVSDEAIDLRVRLEDKVREISN